MMSVEASGGGPPPGGLPSAEERSPSMTSRVRKPPMTAGTANIRYKNLDSKHPGGPLPWAPPLSTASSVRWRNPGDYGMRSKVTGAKYFATYATATSSAAATSSSAGFVHFPRTLSAPSLSGGSQRPTTATTTSSRLGTPFVLPKVTSMVAGIDRSSLASKAPVCEYNFLRAGFYVIAKSDG